MLVDYHNHTPLCAHAEGDPVEFVERAIALGLGEIGFSEHSPWMIQTPDEKLAPTDDEFAQFVRRVQTLQGVYHRGDSPSIRVRLGIEMDYVPDRLDCARAYMDKYPWDYVIGSIHHLNSWAFDNPVFVYEFDRRDIAKVYDVYFDLVRETAAAEMFDVIGHLDVIKKFGHRPPGNLGPVYRDLAGVLKRADVVVELNTSGLDKEAREFYPAPRLLAALARAKVPLTLGSDAHRPAEVGRHFAAARDMLLDMGVREIVTFEKRRRRFVPL